jgi:PEP-CTERM motif-containing protein
MSILLSKSRASAGSQVSISCMKALAWWGTGVNDSNGSALRKVPGAGILGGKRKRARSIGRRRKKAASILPATIDISSVKVSADPSFSAYVFQATDGSESLGEVGQATGTTLFSEVISALNGLPSSITTPFDYHVSVGKDIVSGLFVDGSTDLGLSPMEVVAAEVQSVTDAPEPGSLALLGSGLAALGLIRRRRKSTE